MQGTSIGEYKIFNCLCYILSRSHLTNTCHTAHAHFYLRKLCKHITRTNGLYYASLFSYSFISFTIMHRCGVCRKIDQFNATPPPPRMRAGISTQKKKTSFHNRFLCGLGKDIFNTILAFLDSHSVFLCGPLLMHALRLALLFGIIPD